MPFARTKRSYRSICSANLCSYLFSSSDVILVRSTSLSSIVDWRERTRLCGGRQERGVEGWRRGQERGDEVCVCVYVCMSVCVWVCVCVYVCLFEAVKQSNNKVYGNKINQSKKLPIHFHFCVFKFLFLRVRCTFVRLHYQFHGVCMFDLQVMGLELWGGI